MLDTTPNLSLPYIAAAQAQKHVTHNEAIRRLDALVHLAVLDRDASAPPSTPAEGARYLVPTGATGLFAGHDNAVAAFQDGAWQFLSPAEGWLVWIGDEDQLLVWNGTAWVPAAADGQLNPTPLVGINATADPTNRLAVASAATLFNHAGAGHQLKLNKATAAATASVLFSDAFSGRAEIGLAGDDNLHIKVSADGATWREAAIVTASTGVVSFPQTPATAGENLLINGDFQINQRGFAGGTLAAGAYGIDRWKADVGGASVTRSGYTVTLASGALVQIVEPAVFGSGTFAGATLTLSLDDPTADVAVTIGATTATIPAGSGRRSVTLTPTTAGSLSVRLAAAAAGAVSFARVKLELGSSASPWKSRALPLELALCQRYFVSGADVAYVLGLADTGTTWLSQFLQFPTAMRTTPTITFSNPHNADPTFAVLTGGAFRGGATVAGINGPKGFNGYTTLSAGALSVNASAFAQGTYHASAEL